MDKNIEKIRNHVITNYLSWSNKFPLAVVDKGNSQIQYDTLTFSFNIPANFTPTEDPSIKALGNDLFHKIQQEEIMNFINNLGQPNEENRFSGNSSSLKELVMNEWKYFFSNIATPDTIIWSRKLCAEFMKQTRQGFPPKISDKILTHILIKDPLFTEILLLRKDRYDKIYPVNDQERLVLNIQKDPGGVTSTKFSGRINHKIVNVQERKF